MRLRVMLLGANGQLGSDLRRRIDREGWEMLALCHRDLDVCDAAAVTGALGGFRPHVVINTTAFHKLEACEQEAERAFAVNCHAVRALAESCTRIGARLVHLSTDYVFGGDQTSPYREDAPLNPLNVYGVSKVAGEYFVRNAGNAHLLIRTSGLYGVAGASSKGGNFVETMLRLGREKGRVSVVTDQVLSPTFTDDLAAKIVELIDAGCEGIFHVTNTWQCSWYEFAQAIFELAAPETEVQPVSTAAMAPIVARPHYSVLDNHRLQAEGFAALRSGAEALEAYLGARPNQPAAQTAPR